MIFMDYNIWEIVNETKSNDIVCFGAGEALINFIDRYCDFEIEKCISCIVDNSQKKIGQNIIIKEKKIIIISAEKLRFMDKKKFILLITTRYFDAVYKQLENMAELTDMRFVYYGFVDYRTREENARICLYPNTFRKYNIQRIPKIIHYCWFGGKEIPEDNRKWMESWQRYCPDYEIVEWNESNYDIKKNHFVTECYHRKMWGYIPDYARLDIIYKYGGIYLDTDVELVRSFDELLYQDGFVGVGGRLIMLGLGFGAMKNNSLIGELMRVYENRDPDKEGRLSAPRFEKGFYASHGYKEDGKYQMIENITVLPEKVLCPQDNETEILSMDEHTFSIHHFSGSWVRDEERERKKWIRSFYKRNRRT